MTGADPPRSGDHTFSRRQSSDRSSGSPPFSRSIIEAFCMAVGPKAVASNSSVHAVTGWGGRNRFAPVGGAANGMEANRLTPASVDPRTEPLLV